MAKTRNELLSSCIDNVQQLQSKIYKLNKLNEQDLIPELVEQVNKLRTSFEEDLAIEEANIQELIQQVADDDERVRLEFANEYERATNPYIEIEARR